MHLTVSLLLSNILSSTACMHVHVDHGADGLGESTTLTAIQSPVDCDHEHSLGKQP
jgi:hypothetical protein